MQPTFRTDKADLKKKFLQLSRQFHPDYQIQQDADAQLAALELSAVLNKAYKTLSNEQATMAYFLEWKGLLEEGEKYTLPAPFLMEMLELNEEAAAIAENDLAGREKLAAKIKQAEAEIYEPVEKIVAADAQVGVSEKELLQVKEYFFKKKYLDRLKEQLL